MRVQVYRNLHKKCWSVRYKGKVILHTNDLILKDCTFHVQPAGHKKVLKTKKKNVHAYISGYMCQKVWPNIEYQLITYNPYVADFFYYKSNGKKIEKASLVVLTKNDVFTHRGPQLDVESTVDCS